MTNQSPPPSVQKSDSTKTLYWVLGIIAVVLVVLLCVLGYLIFFSGDAEKAPTPEVTVPPPTGQDLTWEQILASGQLAAGTSGDYPPFAFYNNSYQLDGFDVAMVQEIARRLGLQVVVSDIAFDGLFNAMQVGQIDIAAAAISRTPQREQVVDFSNIYYVGEDAYLVNANSPIQSITSPNDLVGKRIGVERDTVFETWVRQTLIDTGMMPESNLFTYDIISQAVDDLRQNVIDVVILDVNPANEYVAAGGVKMAGRGLNPQYYAIALPKGALELKSKIDEALGQMQADGTMASLATRYLGQTTGTLPPVVTPTPAPPLPTATPQPCIASMEYVEDLTYDDQDMTRPPVLYPGTPFVKGWRIRNNGTCPWDSSYRLVYVGGNVPAAQMGGQPTPINGVVQPGAVYDLYIQLVAPFTPGVYQGFWQMQGPSGQYFGSRIWVGIAVSTDGTVPGVQPPVIQRFQANPEQIVIGQCVLVDWNIEGEMDSVVLLRNEQEIYRGAVVNGSREDCPPVVGNTLYVLQATGPGGTSTRNRTVVVSDQVIPTPLPPTQPPPPTATPTNPPPPTAIPTTPPPVVNPPVIYSFVAQPSQVNVGQCVNVSWDVGGDPESIRILRNGTLAADNLPASGGGQDCFSEGGSVDYQLEASGQGQTVSAQASVQVILQASFQLVSLRNSAGETVPVLPGTSITLNINGNQISGSAGCNNYNTTYAQNGEELAVQPPQVTLQMCGEPAGIMEQESQYLTNLQMANRYRSSGPTLELIARTIDPASGTEVDLVVLVYNMAR